MKLVIEIPDDIYAHLVYAVAKVESYRDKIDSPDVIAANAEALAKAKSEGKEEFFVADIVPLVDNPTTKETFLYDKLTGYMRNYLEAVPMPVDLSSVIITTGA